MVYIKKPKPEGYGFSLLYPREYNSFSHAKQRCINPKAHNYHYYGGRGIKFKFVSFKQFVEHMGMRPNGTSLNRINNDGHYEIGNVEWANRRTQNLNMRRRKRGLTKRSIVYRMMSGC